MQQLRVTVFVLVLSLLLGSVFTENASGGTYWYGGDWDVSGGITNVCDTADPVTIGVASVYETFVVAGSAWRVQTVWANEFYANWQKQPDPLGTLAYWEIRTSLSSGAGGTLVASGEGSAEVAPTGRVYADDLYTEYSIRIAGLDTWLFPGRYWLSVIPTYSYGWDGPYVSETQGENSVGALGDDRATAFIHAPGLGYAWVPIDENLPDIGHRARLSFGIGGPASVVPEPKGFSLLGIAIVGLCAWRAGRRGNWPLNERDV